MRERHKNGADEYCLVLAPFYVRQDTTELTISMSSFGSRLLTSGVV